jgi:predicted porin
MTSFRFSAVLVGTTVGLLCVPSLAQQVTLSGRVDMSVSYQSRIFVNGQVTNQSVKTVDSGGNGGSRLNFSGQEDLGGGNQAMFVLEQGIQADTGVLGQGGRAFGRQAYVGLQGQWGRLTLGRQYTPWFETQSISDPFNNGLVGNAGNVELANSRVD